MTRYQQELLERLVKAIEADVNERIEERKQKRAKGKKEATAMSAVLLTLISTLWIDIAMGDPFVKWAVHNGQSLAVAVSVTTVIGALLYRAFRMEVIPLSMVVGFSLYAGGIAAYIGYTQAKDATFRVVSIFFAFYVLMVFFRDYLPENEKMRHRWERLADWLNEHKIVGAIVGIAFALLPLALVVYAIGLTVFGLTLIPILLIFIYVLGERFIWLPIKRRMKKT